MRGLSRWAVVGVNRPGEHYITFKVEKSRPVLVDAGLYQAALWHHCIWELEIGNNFLVTREIPEASLAEQAIQWVP